MDIVRPGLAIYGINPFEKNFISSCKNEELLNALSKLRPILSFKAKISFIKKVPKGYSISYGCTYITKKESMIGTIPVGYSDGYSRFLSNRQVVLVSGEFAPIVGNITMDQLMIDLTDVFKKNKIKVGDEVVLVGKQGKNEILAYDIAHSINSIPNEFLTCLSNKLPKIYT
jgi:alanine racemase